MTKRILPLLVSVLLGVASCIVPSDPEVPRPHSGARNHPDEGLVLHLGERCPQVVKVTVEFQTEEDRVLGTWEITSADPQGSPLETLTVGTTPDGFSATGEVEPDWLVSGTAALDVESAGGEASPDHHVLDSLREETRDHPDEWRIQDVGWVTATEIVSEDEFRLSMCAEDEDQSG